MISFHIFLLFFFPDIMSNILLTIHYPGHWQKWLYKSWIKVPFFLLEVLTSSNWISWKIFYWWYFFWIGYSSHKTFLYLHKRYFTNLQIDQIFILNNKVPWNFCCAWTCSNVKCFGKDTKLKIYCREKKKGTTNSSH